ncbi:undecaprenyldiphospho-muramoylpentapeptide beta-N-acetylglucosaminyltransferase [Chitinispirillales bacterium ANBcel5]|uniref:undecaprenyldiphospho-muramoylpentapeptide beta-N-acetylglucosaminyltransferase n=1 Tax=Cellulosispirillum alkaliphilum TaxID=3039283 RepID=UPI002A5838EC|nr:undecaprenyldiphospho-muramoylpentapeptide beta-N-acetylglucosaminyltransferase [Chitinispirillales bacterium ANBcel5]
MKRIVLTGGGTAGHVTPNLALLPALKELSFDIHYIGTKSGIERKLVAREGVTYHPVSAGKLRRYFDFKNFTDLFKIALGFFQALVLMVKLRPGVVFSKGGFVSCPVVWAARLFGIPVIIHESDITPGLANKLCAPFAQKICFSFPETEAHIKEKKRVYTGLPVRDSLLRGSATQGRKLCSFDNELPVILVMGGSLGAKVINETIRESLDTLLEEFNICHLCGKGALIERNVPGYCQFEYVNEELAHLMAAADIVVSRSGATSLFEFLALKKPNLLIPLSTGASRGDQILNAQSFEKQGFSRVLLQEEMTVTTLTENIRDLYRDRRRYVEAMGSAKALEGKAKIVELLTEVL